MLIRMSTDRDRSSNSVKPARATSQWRSPPSGYPNRDPRVVVHLESWFEEAVPYESFKPWKLIRAVASLLGDHRVELWCVEDAKILLPSPLLWSTRSTGMELRTTTDLLRDRRTWESLASRWSTFWTIRAYRGGGKHRHEVWSLHVQWWPDRRNYPGRIEFSLATRHVADAQLKALHRLIEMFFSCSASGGCTYGRGDAVLRAREYIDLELDPAHLPMVEYHRHLCTSWDDRVPWVHRFNLLNAKHMRQLGPADAIVNPLNRLGGSISAKTMKDKVLLTLDPLCEFNLEGRLSGDPPFLKPAGLSVPWVLSRFVKGGLLAMQRLDWLDASMAELESIKQAAANPLPKVKPKPKRQSAQLKAAMNRPPRFLKPSGRRTLAAFPEVFKREGISARTAHWSVFPTEPRQSRAMTLFGVGSRDSHQLHTLIRAGSMKDDRAAFTFHELRDGWNGEQVGELHNVRHRLRQLTCPRCDGRQFDLDVALEYPDDLDELSESEQAHAEDFFSWFWLAARCPACNWEGVVADVECA